MEKASIRVMVVDDSAVMRSAWCRVLKGLDQIELVALAENGKSALDRIRQGGIDLVVMDLEMPIMDGITAIRKIRKEFPKTRIIVVSAFTTQGSKKAIEALTAGASDCVSKPKAVGLSAEFKEVTETLVGKVMALAGGKLNSTSIVQPRRLFSRMNPKVIVIGSSTGGPNALAELLSQVSQKVDWPILVVQHMPPMFTTLLAKRLAEESGRCCQEAVDGEPVLPGKIYLAPGDYHMIVEKKVQSDEAMLAVRKFPPENYCRPAVDPLFRTAAESYGEGTLAVVLTGMGEDGKLGAREVIRKGGLVLAQDEGTSVVWGMPGAVVQDGSASAALPIPLLAAKINELWKRGELCK